MNKIAIVFAAAGLMALAACGEKPAAEENNASNAVVVNEPEMNAAANAMENAADNMSMAANTMSNASNEMNAAH